MTLDEIKVAMEGKRSTDSDTAVHINRTTLVQNSRYFTKADGVDDLCRTLR